MKTSHISTNRQRQLIGDLTTLVDERRRREVEIEDQFAARSAELESEHTRACAHATAEYETESGGINQKYTDLLATARSRFEAKTDVLDQEQVRYTQHLDSQNEQSLSAVKHNRERARRIAVQSFDVATREANTELEDFQNACANHRYELQLVIQHVDLILASRRCRSVSSTCDPDERTTGFAPARERFDAEKALAIAKLSELDGQRAAKFLDEGWIFLFFLFGAAICIVPAGWLLSWSGWFWMAASAGAGVIVAALLVLPIYRVVRKQTRHVVSQIQQAVVNAEAALEASLIAAHEQTRLKHQELAERRMKEVDESNEEWNQISGELSVQHGSRTHDAASELEAHRKAIHQQWEECIAPYKEKYPPRLDQLRQQYEAETSALKQKHEREVAELTSVYESEWHQLIDRWTGGLDKFQAAVAQMNEYCKTQFPDWESIAWSDWQPSADPVRAVRFGRYVLDLGRIEGGMPTDSRLKVPQERFSIPAVLSLPASPSLLLETEDDGRQVAIHALQNVMLRLLTSMPPGKVRFTIIDPTGLGQNFSAFMHLADYDERLVASRIWTETAHIQQRLTDVTQHMEDVIQKYLRNEFESIQEYNEHAGEVAEPFQILVIANFPANFSEEAARKLVSIAASGARCGVFTLMSCDRKLNVPRNFDLDMTDLRANATTLEWSEGRFVWNYGDLRELPLELDKPPADEGFTEAVRAAGRYAKDFSRVEVPFSAVAPADDQWWTKDSRGGIDVALGRAGATKLQYLRLGEGTSQHVLIVGKTGSGKSTLLHALISNTALHYGPHEVEFYLIDFKKGVEFKPYARMNLPHARVVAIESEREFGMSVLQRLDGELHRRGDLFRSAAVQDVAGYRNAHPDELLPRILLIIDEFQELFVKDDKIAQDASLLLDRLVRQGRAFGIHVLLGSQTLAGAYSLARSTIGQMAVRIALQCSEADAHLILSEENTAARLLNRPGEAIYNNANGMFEGNHPFQVVWLPDHEREVILGRIQQLAVERDVGSKPLIVFEGNIPADPEENTKLHELLSEPVRQARLAPRIWLGAAVAIKDPTMTAFHRQSGSNLLMVGQQEELAMGVLANSLICLAAEQQAGRTQPPDQLDRFYVLDGTRPESPEAGFWERFARRLPMQLQIVRPPKMAEAIGQVASQLNQRMDSEDETAPSIFLVVYNLGRFRDLRKSADDFSYGFSSRDEDEPSNPAGQFQHILREGSAYGVHSIIWCDNYTNVSRWIDRPTMRDLATRVLFQMSASDSSNLMDSPVASRLGVHRAILYNDEHGQYEKFRPYGLPTDKWLDWVAGKLQARPAAELPT